MRPLISIVAFLAAASFQLTAAANPGITKGKESGVFERPDTFLFHRGADGNWDVPGNFTPALFPQAGETVIAEEEMETTATVFEADIVLQDGGSIRLRGDPDKNHTCTGSIFMEEGTSLRYNTSGTGMYINGPVFTRGTVIMNMESSNSGGSTMTLAGPVSGSDTIVALNNGKGTVNSGNLLLTGDNRNFTGTWDVTRYSAKFPSTPGYVTTIEGKSEYAFGKGNLVIGPDNKVIFTHSKAAGDTLVLTLEGNAKIVLNVDVAVKNMILNGIAMEDGSYSVTTHPALFEGSGKIIVGEGEPEPTETLAAFPGAEGYGRFATGGRGGQVIYVTNLSDDGAPGSLRYAVSRSGPRIVLFKVSGTIRLQSRLDIANDNITLAGQTAPGDGITIRDYPVVVNADNVVIRFMRFRMGDAAAQEADALGGRYHQQILVDHCSMSWSTDECVSFYQNEDLTLQWCIISESLRNSVHEKGAHGYGGIWGGKRASFHHNLLAHHDSRNPRLGENHGEIFALTDLVDLRNNVIYNWHGNSAYGGEAMNANFVNCYYKPGPATTKIERIISIDKLIDAEDEASPIFNTWGTFHIAGNVLAGSPRATDDNWTYGVYNQFNAKYGTVPENEKEAMRLAEPLDPGEVTTQTAEIAYERILQFGGASLARDEVDQRILHDVSTGTATYMDGGNGSVNGIIDTQDAVGGWPQLESLPAPDDSDNDGMPDDWEDDNGLNPDDPADAQTITVDGEYPNIEVYLNSLVEDITSQQNLEVIDTTTERTGKNLPDEQILYYNDLTHQLIVNHHSRVMHISIHSLSGETVLQGTFHSKEIQWKLPDIPSGIFIVRLVDEDHMVYSIKMPVFAP